MDFTRDQIRARLRVVAQALAGNKAAARAGDQLEDADRVAAGELS
jgi:hypothetical protein